jgi:hypothetical protein
MKTIPLTQGYVARVDDGDFGRLSQFKWCAHVEKLMGRTLIYACRNSPRTKGKRSTLIYMHRVILTSENYVDHHDGDGLNNQRYNLRASTNSQNQANRRHRAGSSIYRGVSLMASGKWRASLVKNQVRLNIGRFKEEADAALAYNLAALEAFGPYASLNTPRIR